MLFSFVFFIVNIIFIYYKELRHYLSSFSSLSYLVCPKMKWKYNKADKTKLCKRLKFCDTIMGIICSLTPLLKYPASRLPGRVMILSLVRPVTKCARSRNSWHVFPDLTLPSLLSPRMGFTEKLQEIP